MSNFRKILAVIFAILFVGTGVFALILFNFDRRAFTVETYQKAFVNEGFYEKLPTVMAEAMISADTDQTKLPVVMRGMSTQAWESFFRAILPAETIKEMSDGTLNSIVAYLNMEADSAEITLAPLKASMVSERGVQAVFELLKTQPDCTLLELGQMALDLLGKQEMLLCNPPADMIPLLTPVVQIQLQAAAAAIPDQISLAGADETNDPRQKFQIIRLLMRLSPLLPLGFLFLLTITAVNSFRSWLQWWGISFTATGLVVMVMGLSGAPITGALFNYIMTKQTTVFLPTAFSNYAGAVASAMVGAITIPIFWQGLILLFLGLGMVLILAMMFIVRKVTQK